MSAALSLKGLTKHYPKQIALDGVDLDVAPGEFITLLGPSGSGKSTTLNLIAGLVEPTAGTIHLNGSDISQVPAHKRNIGVVFQHYALFPHMTVSENIAYPLKQRSVAKSERQESVARALEMVHLQDMGDRYPRQLSGGQQQRVAVARALVFRPNLLLMDEPLGALDKKLREWLQLELKRIHRQLGTTFIYVTHDQEEALVLSDRIAVFNRGRIEQVGTAEELYDSPKTLFVGRFIGESSVFSGTATTLESGVTKVETEDGLLNAIGATSARQVAILVRPERLCVAGSEHDRPGENVVQGTVKEVVYLGADRKYEVELPSGNGIIVREPASREVHKIGDFVTVSWWPRDCVLLEQTERDALTDVNMEM